MKKLKKIFWSFVLVAFVLLVIRNAFLLGKVLQGVLPEFVISFVIGSIFLCLVTVIVSLVVLGIKKIKDDFKN